VQIRHLRFFDFETSAAGLVYELQLKLVPPLQAEHGGNVHAVIDIGDEAPAGDLDFGRLGRKRDGKHSVNRREAYRLRDLAAFSLGARLGRKLVLFGLGRGWQAELEAEQDRR